MTDERALRDLLDRVARPTERLDVVALSGRLRRRRRRRLAARTAASATLVLVLVVGIQAVLPTDTEGPVQLADRADGLVEVDPRTAVAAGVPPLTAEELQLQPTRLPEGYQRCAGPIPRYGVRTTTFCAPDRPDLQLAQGPHFALPEVGEELAVAERIGYLQQGAAVTELTVSDGNRVDDRHHRLTVADPDADEQEMAAVLASIPAVATAPAPPADG